MNPPKGITCAGRKEGRKGGRKEGKDKPSEEEKEEWETALQSPATGACT